MMEVDLFSSPDKINDQSINSRTPRSSTKKRNFRSIFKQQPQQLTSPQWFNNYRDRCLNKWHIRNEERRANLFNQFRKIKLDECDQNDSIQQVMNDVWIELNGPVIDHDEMIEYYEQFLLPLKQELNEMDRCYPDESDTLEWQELLDNQYTITCMLCWRAIWTLEHRQESTEIRCSNCGFTLITRLIFNEKQLFDRVEELLNQHNYGANTAKEYLRCAEKLKFQPIIAGDNSLKNIKLECNSCDFDVLLL